MEALINNVIKDSFEASLNVKKKMLEDESLQHCIHSAALHCINALKNDNKILLAGNGGSAADAQHLAAEFVSLFEFERSSLPAMSLATDTSILTAIGNDYGYENIFSRQISSYGRPDNVFVGITTSGKSKNILKAFEEAKAMKMTTIGISGIACDQMEKNCDILVKVPSCNTARIQEAHILIGHTIFAATERAIFGEDI